MRSGGGVPVAERSGVRGERAGELGCPVYGGGSQTQRQHGGKRGINVGDGDGFKEPERPSGVEQPPAQETTGMAPEGESKVVEAAIRGDHAALQRLWHEHRRWVAAVLLANKPRDADLDDLLQDVATQVVAKVGGLREAAAFKPWLRAVALNVAKTAGRKRSVRVAAVLKMIGGMKSDEEPSRPAEATGGEAREEGARLMRLASQLPDGYREPLLMRCVQGMGYREIGAVMGLPETTIETRIARGRRMLRELAEKAMGTGTGASGVGGSEAVGQVAGREVLNG